MFTHIYTCTLLPYCACQAREQPRAWCGGSIVRCYGCAKARCLPIPAFPGPGRAAGTRGAVPRRSHRGLIKTQRPGGRSLHFLGASERHPALLLHTSTHHLSYSTRPLLLTVIAASLPSQHTLTRRRSEMHTCHVNSVPCSHQTRNMCGS